MLNNVQNARNTNGHTYLASTIQEPIRAPSSGGRIRDQAHPWQQLHAAECGEDLQHQMELFGAGSVGGWSSSPPLCCS